MNRRILTLAAVALATLVGAGASFAASAKGGAIPTDWKQIKKPALGKFQIPEPKRIELSNGMTVFLLEDHELPFVDVTAMVRTGGRFVPQAKTGLADVFGETWRTGGTKTRTGDQLDDYLEARAAKVETWMSEDSAGVSMNCLKQDFDDVLAVFTDVLRNPAFAEDKIKLAKTQVNTGISRRNDEPDGIASREATRLGYGPNSPYSWIPEYDTVAAVTREDLVGWHARTVHPNRILLGIVGDFSSDAIIAKLKATFESWPKGPDAKDPLPAIDTASRAGVYFVEKSDVNQSNIAMVHLGTTRDNPDYYALEVMNEVFGGGFSARLFSNVRSKKGLAYSVGGGVGTGYDRPGLFRLQMSTKSATTAAAIDALYEEIDAITGKVPATAAELQKAKDAILNSFIFRFDSRDKVLRQQMTYAFYGYPDDFLSRYRDGIEKVTVDDVNRVAKKYIHKDQVAVLVVGKGADFDRPLSSFGAVKAIDITIPQPKGPEKAAATAESSAKGKAAWTKVVESLGGAKKVASVKEMRSVAKLNLTKPMPMSLDAVSSILLPTSLRQDIKTPMGDLAIVVTSDGGWQAMGPQSMDLPPSAKEEALKEILRHPIVISQALAAGKATINHAGTEKVGAATCDILDVVNGGAEIRFFVDPANGRIVRSAYRATGDEGPVESVTDYADWKQIDGIWVALSEKVKHNGEDSQSIVTSEFKVNPGLDPKLFVKPAK